jgi:hypothetical protein
MPREQRLEVAFAAGLVCILCAGFASPARQSGSPQGSFSDRTAHALLEQIASGLVAQNRNQMLGAFDLDKMTDGPLFKQQVTSLFSQTVNIRVHFDQIQTSVEEGRGIATVEFELEAGRTDDRLPPLYKQAQLHFVAENTGGKWKFTDVQPRTFFSIQP